MTQQPPTAALSLYPHLKSGVPEPVQRHDHTGSIADAMYPSLVAKPKPAPNRSHQSADMSLAARCDENPWLEHRLALAGLVRKR